MKKAIICLILIVSMLAGISVGTPVSAEIVTSNAWLPFTDVGEGSWYYDGALFCYVNNIIQGQGNKHTFAPNVNMTRATFVVMLARVAGADTTAYTESRFTDCKASWYIPSVEWAADNGYVSGTGEGVFSPDKTMTRQEMAVLLSRFMQAQSYDVTVAEGTIDAYSDKDSISDWALDGMEYAISAGIIGSTSSNALVSSPKMTLTRAQAAIIFHRFMESFYYADCPHAFYEPSCTEGERCYKCGMVVSLPNGHRCDNLTCNSDDICKVCGENVPADEGLHIYNAATCILPETCGVCGKTRGKALGHSYSPATCLAPETCTRCMETRGGPSGHSTDKGICKDCGLEIFESEYERIGYYFVNQGIYTDKGCYVIGKVEEYRDHIGYTQMSCYNSIDAFVFAYEYIDIFAKKTVTLQITIPEISDTYSYTFNLYDNGVLSASASGNLIAAEVTEDTLLTLDSYSGATDRAESEKLFNTVFAECIQQTDLTLDGLCGAGVADFGFVNISWQN